MLKPWLKRPIQIVETLALVALAVIVYRRTDWRKGFTPDGVMTLMAGVIAFFAVIIQIRFSSRQVQEQLTVQRDAQREETDRQKRAVACALLFEIDGFYRWLLRDIRGFLRDVDPEKEDFRFLEAKPIGTNPFVIYQGNASSVGELDVPVAENVVRFYMGAQACLYTIQRYDEAHSQYLAAPTEEREDLARQWLENVKEGIPPLIVIADVVCRQLCMVLSIRFESPRIAVAGEDMEGVKQEIIKMGESDVFKPER
jgi:hypothetical protein